jgi:hypothetical protein
MPYPPDRPPFNDPLLPYSLFVPVYLPLHQPYSFNLHKILYKCKCKFIWKMKKEWGEAI